MNTLTDNDILALKRVKVQHVAAYLGLPVRNIQEGLQNNLFPFGTAYKKSEWVYLIFAERLIKYKHGYDLMKSERIA